MRSSAHRIKAVGADQQQRHGLGGFPMLHAVDSWRALWFWRSRRLATRKPRAVALASVSARIHRRPRAHETRGSTLLSQRRERRRASGLVARWGWPALACALGGLAVWCVMPERHDRADERVEPAPASNQVSAEQPTGPVRFAARDATDQSHTDTSEVRERVIGPIAGLPLEGPDRAATTALRADRLAELPVEADDLAARRRRLTQAWAAIMSSSHAPDPPRQAFLTDMATDLFGDQGSAELTRLQDSDEARRELARHREHRQWLQGQFARLRADTSVTRSERQAAVRRLLDEYLDRIAGRSDGEAPD